MKKYLFLLNKILFIFIVSFAVFQLHAMDKNLQKAINLSLKTKRDEDERRQLESDREYAQFLQDQYSSHNNQKKIKQENGVQKKNKKKVTRKSFDNNPSKKRSKNKVKKIVRNKPKKVVKSESAVYRFEHKNVSFIQIQCCGQTGATCGEHAMVNAGVFAIYDNFISCKSELNSSALLKKIKSEYKRGQNLSSDSLTSWNNSRISSLVPASNGVYRTILGFYDSKQILSKLKTKNNNKNPLIIFNGGLNLRLNDLLKKQKVSSLDFIYGVNVVKNADDPRWCFRQKNPKPETFVFNTGGHWIAVKLQYQNGKLQVIFSDSGAGKKNVIKGYLGKLLELVKYIRGF